MLHLEPVGCLCESYYLETYSGVCQPILLQIAIGSLDEVLHLFAIDKTFGETEVIGRAGFYLDDRYKIVLLGNYIYFEMPITLIFCQYAVSFVFEIPDSKRFAFLPKSILFHFLFEFTKTYKPNANHQGFWVLYFSYVATTPFTNFTVWFARK